MTTIALQPRMQKQKQNQGRGGRIRWTAVEDAALQSAMERLGYAPTAAGTRSGSLSENGSNENARFENAGLENAGLENAGLENAESENAGNSGAGRRSGSVPWARIAREAGLERSGDQCAQRWMRVLRPGIARHGWTASEDATLRRRVACFGARWWRDVARGLPGRTDQQARARWALLSAREGASQERQIHQHQHPQSQHQQRGDENQHGAMQQQQQQHHHHQVLIYDCTEAVRKGRPLTSDIALQRETLRVAAEAARIAIPALLNPH
eukprot:TRINITY_DN2655_c0_g1_i13.p1 TRINITY_DN2655_c0_g1~~TRINITY_DN2655_c0_g1_i13.p1  ORF type:complete len:268 (+),score=18.94 TRINITY_DN2655_c0_g1_i13:564-1367(+)